MLYNIDSTCDVKKGNKKLTPKRKTKNKREIKNVEQHSIE